MTRKIVIIGAGAGGRFTKEICDAVGREVHGYLDDFKEKDLLVAGLPILGPCLSVEDAGFTRSFDFIICLGDIPLRRRVYETIRERSGCMASVIHPAATVSVSAKIGDGVVVNAQAMIHPGAWIGDIVLVEGHSNVGVDNVIEDNVLMATGIMLNGSVVIKRDSFIGSGTIVIPQKTIGERCYIGAGATVTKDIPDGKLAVGVPARVIKNSPILFT